MPGPGSKSWLPSNRSESSTKRSVTGNRCRRYSNNRHSFHIPSGKWVPLRRSRSPGCSANRTRKPRRSSALPGTPRSPRTRRCKRYSHNRSRRRSCSRPRKIQCRSSRRHSSAPRRRAYRCNAHRNFGRSRSGCPRGRSPVRCRRACRLGLCRSSPDSCSCRPARSERCNPSHLDRFRRCHWRLGRSRIPPRCNRVCTRQGKCPRRWLLPPRSLRRLRPPRRRRHCSRRTRGCRRRCRRAASSGAARAGRPARAASRRPG